MFETAWREWHMFCLVQAQVHSIVNTKVLFAYVGGFDGTKCWHQKKQELLQLDLTNVINTDRR